MALPMMPPSWAFVRPAPPIPGSGDDVARTLSTLVGMSLATALEVTGAPVGSLGDMVVVTVVVDVTASPPSMVVVTVFV